MLTSTMEYETKPPVIINIIELKLTGKKVLNKKTKTPKMTEPSSGFPMILM